MIIGASGFAGSGKTEFSRYLVSKHNFVALSFADGVKDAVAAVFDWPRQRLSGLTPEDRAWRETPEPFWSTTMGKDVTPRWAMQFIGTELIRNQLFVDMWAQRVAHIIATGPTDTNYVIDDVRFQNEQDVLAKLGTKFVVIHRAAVVQNNAHYKALWDSEFGLGDGEVKYVAPEIKQLALDTLHPSEYDWFMNRGWGRHDSWMLTNDGNKLSTWQNTIEDWYQSNFNTEYSGKILGA